jgi:nucleotide-binding universal stress UspA family protein
MFKTILCPVDGSDHANKALRLAIDLARTYDAKLVLLHNILMNADAGDLQRFAEIEGLAKSVKPEISRLQAVRGRLDYGFEEPPAGLSRMYVEIGQSVLDGAKNDAVDAGLKQIETIMTDGDAAERILHCIGEKKIDCVVMGSRGLSDMKALYLGSVSHKVLNKAPCTCIAVK